MATTAIAFPTLNLTSSEIWVALAAKQDFTLFTESVPCEGFAKAEKWLEWKRQQGASFFHVNERRNYDEYLARLIASSPTPEACRNALQPAVQHL